MKWNCIEEVEKVEHVRRRRSACIGFYYKAFRIALVALSSKSHSIGIATYTIPLGSSSMLSIYDELHLSTPLDIKMSLHVQQWQSYGPDLLQVSSSSGLEDCEGLSRAGGFWRGRSGMVESEYYLIDLSLRISGDVVTQTRQCAGFWKCVDSI